MRHASWLVAALLLAPLTASAQSYQRYADGLVSVHARKLVTADHHLEFRVCVELVRQEEPARVKVHLIFRDASDAVLAQETRVLDAEFRRPACRTVALPVEPARMSRWEISRFRLQRPPLGPAGREYPASAHLTLP